MTQGIASSNRVKKVQRGSTDDKNPKNLAKDFTLDVRFNYSMEHRARFHDIDIF